MRGIFAVDPGGHTGIAQSVVDISASSLQEAMTKRLLPASFTVEGPPQVQIPLIYGHWMRFKRECVRRFIAPQDIDLVMEDFILWAGQHAGGKDGTFPERVAWGFEGYRMGRAAAFRPARLRHYTPVTWQQPADRRRLATRKQLTLMNAWVKGTGREHERAAYAHLAVRVSRLMQGRRIS